MAEAGFQPAGFMSPQIFGLPVERKVLFSNHKDVYKKRIEKRQRKLFVKIGLLVQIVGPCVKTKGVPGAAFTHAPCHPHRLETTYSENERPESNVEDSGSSTRRLVPDRRGACLQERNIHGIARRSRRDPSVFVAHNVSSRIIN